MKKIIFLSLILNIFLYAQWKSISINYNASLYSVQFFDSTTGIICGANGLILRSTDGGKNWVPNLNFINTTPDLYSTSLYNNTSGWICGRYGTLLQTQDQGNTWILRQGPGGNYLTQIIFVNDTVGWMCAATNSLFRTKFGDGYWTQEYISRNQIAMGYMYTKDGNTGYVVGEAGLAEKTTDHGYSWEVLNTGTTAKLENITFANDSLGWIVGDKGVILKTTDSGKSWTSYNDYSYHFNWVTFVNDTVGWIVGGNGSILKTTNSGATWDSIPSGTNAILRMIYFKDENHGIIVGDSGKVLLYDTSFVTSVNQKLNSNQSLVYDISQNYPNPFNPTTTIKYSIPKRSLVTIKVYNSLGKEITTLVNEEKPAGNYSVEFSTEGGYTSGRNASKLASGVYYYRMQAGSFAATKKLILLK